MEDTDIGVHETMVKVVVVLIPYSSNVNGRHGYWGPRNHGKGRGCLNPNKEGTGVLIDNTIITGEVDMAFIKTVVAGSTYKREASSFR